ncbi:MAG: membrane protein insertion efficiency factor YidD [Acholeplasmatales bacterium]|nr:membrane protein insertion efficiency factor YidD [Acholeplasmatales bacterium]
MYINKICIKLIEWYQRSVSPHSSKKCRYIPSCSEYSKICYLKFNFLKASFLTLFRLLRCNPLFKQRYDYPPKRRFIK